MNRGSNGNKPGGSKHPPENPSTKRIVITIVLLLFIIFAIKSCINGNKADASTENSQISKDISALNGKTLLEAKNLADEKKYSFSYMREIDNTDMTDVIKDYDEDMLKSYSITKTSAVSDDSAKITYANEEDKQKMELKKTLSEKLDPAHAWQAVEAYGENEYPYGFKLHYVSGKLAETPLDESTWSLKGACTVTNEANAKQDLTCEATVMGTTDDPKVVDFLVY